MADRAIGELPAAGQVDDTSLLAVEQQGRAMKVTGAQFKEYAKLSVKGYADAAKQSAENAAKSAQDASASAIDANKSAQDALKNAETAKQYSGKPPTIKNGTWWIWNATTQQYEDTGEAARGNLMYATFEIDPATGDLWMYTDKEYTGPTFRLVDGNLEVVLNGRS